MRTGFWANTCDIKSSQEQMVGVIRFILYRK